MIFDRDGTLIKYVPYLINIEDLEIDQRIFPQLRKLNRIYKFGIISNQSAIGRGFATESHVAEINSKIISIFGEQDIRFEFIKICGHTPEDKCKCRKPGTALFDEAKKEFGILASESYYIGDSLIDIEFAYNSGMKPAFVNREEINITEDICISGENLYTVLESFLKGKHADTRIN